MVRGYAVLASVLLTLWHAPAALAEDIDLFTGMQSNAGTHPNVLILMDNAAAWSANAPFTCDVPGVVSDRNLNTDVGVEQCGLYKAISALTRDPAMTGKLNLGLMMFGQGTNPGGQFRFPAVTPPSAPAGLRLMDAKGGEDFLTYIKTIDVVDDKANGSQVGGGMQEAWAFFAGQRGLSGTQYKSPITNPCQKNFVIYIANAMNNGKPQDTGQEPYNELVKANASKAQLQPITTPVGNKYLDNWGDEWARFMYNADLNAAGNTGSSTATRQNIITYTIAITEDGKNSKDYADFVGSMASNGGGGNFVVKLGDFKALADALQKIFNEMQAVNNVFASVSLPVSVNGQGSYLNQVFIGMFRPDAQASPRWTGNLKQYKLGYDSSNKLVLLDAGTPDSSGNLVVNNALSNAGTGFISPNARSFWTADPPKQFTSAGYSSADIDKWPATGFWTNAIADLNGAKEAIDGPLVEKGGAGEMLRAQFLTDRGPRQLLTCPSPKCSAAAGLARFDTANAALTDSAGIAALNSSASDVANLINWVRGSDVFAARTDDIPAKETIKGPGDPVTVRGSIHGDVLHSRPVAVDYGGTTGLVVFYGANDGVFHAINGNQQKGISTDAGVVRPGGELWGFIPPEFYGKLSRIYTNTPEVQLTGGPTGPGFAPRDYFFDGTATVYQNMSSPAAPKVHLYLTARRGGRLIYALDVSNPAKPTYLWSKTNSDIPELGQTWSQPRVIRVKGRDDPLLIMGAGYDTSEDSDPAPGKNVMGRGLIVLNAISGDLVWAALPDCTGLAAGTCVTAQMRAVPSDVTVVDRDGDGYADKAYVGDVGGNVWRADFRSSKGNTPEFWTIAQLASLGGVGNAARKFFYPPDVVLTKNYEAVLIGSGDREHPLYSYNTSPDAAQNVKNRFYMLKDPNVGTGVPSDWTPIKEAMLADVSAADAEYKDSPLFSGFFIGLRPGEKVVNAPLTVGRYTYFGTNTPSPIQTGACYPDLGEARGYAISFLTGKGESPDGSRSEKFSTGGLAPSPVFGMVAIESSNGTPAKVVPVMIGTGVQDGKGENNGRPPFQPREPSPPNVGKRKRAFWYTQTDKQ
ncbi:pilus assembly protein [Cupriavidus sp. SK-4]|uniref:pilus assembly protein n=1 Tax=Cupriavidus sp. SK-4 TaxID=574750 RepID=UPI00056BB522|nr:PilC/PilY family type IV pilus protein [Cupriavidus sp. SK-4]